MRTRSADIAIARQLSGRFASGSSARSRGFGATVASLMLPLLLVVGATGAARADPVPSVLYESHSGVWFDPNRSGEGFVVELIGTDTATLTWFTYDDDGEQRWLVGAGGVVHSAMEGTYLSFPELYDTSGGVFGEQFDPSQVQRRLVGSARIAFEGCSRGLLSYEAYDSSGSFAIERIGNAMGLSCSPRHGDAAEKIEPYAGQSGTWWDPSRSGEGFQLQWSSQDQAYLTWYSYDANGRQYWMTGLGVREGERISFPSLIATRGARFGAAFDPEDVERFHWGSLALELDCDSGQATYSSDIPGFESGSQALERLTGLFGISCPWHEVALSDLYDIQVTIVPTVLPPAPLPLSVQALSIADDGTLVGATAQGGRFLLHRRSPEAGEWEAIGDYTLSGTPFQISPDAATILVDPFPPFGPTAPLLWKASTGMQTISGTVFDESYASVGSLHLSHLVGVARPSGDPLHYPWIWSEQAGQIELPRTEDIRLAYPTGVSETGDVVVGFSEAPGPNGRMASSAIRWEGAANPIHLIDSYGAKLGAASTCNANCSVVYGGGQLPNDENEHPNWRQPWIMLANGTVLYLGHLEDAHLGLSGSPYLPRATTADGSMAVGSYTVPSGVVQVDTQPFLWTKLTGLVALRQVAIERNSAIEAWEDMYAMDVSSDGSLILLLGVEKPPGPYSTIFRAAIIELRPIVFGDTAAQLGSMK